MPDVPRQTARAGKRLPPLTTPPPTPVETVIKTISGYIAFQRLDTLPMLRPARR
ncbi:hypothetical protein O5511_03250 [Escherichia coli]|nr:hypothetical protein [Escherichia coli]